MHHAAPSFAPQRAPCGGATAHNFFASMQVMCRHADTAPAVAPPPGRRSPNESFFLIDFVDLMDPCPPHHAAAPTVSGRLFRNPSLNSTFMRPLTGGRSPRRRAQQPAPVVPIKWTSAGVHEVAARPRAAMRGPARPVIHVEIGHFSTSSQ